MIVLKKQLKASHYIKALISYYRAKEWMENFDDTIFIPEKATYFSKLFKDYNPYAVFPDLENGVPCCFMRMKIYFEDTKPKNSTDINIIEEDI